MSELAPFIWPIGMTKAQVLLEFAQECAGHGGPVDLLTAKQVGERTVASMQKVWCRAGFEL